MLKIPNEIINEVENESEGLNHGIVNLGIFIRDGKPRYVITRERSIMPETLLESEGSKSVIRKKHYNLKKGLME